MSNKLELQSNNDLIQSLINKANNLPDYEDVTPEVTAQDSLIAQIQSALDGKASGSGGATLDDIGVFTFDITGDAQFLFIKGMTFGEFMNSKMNTKQFTDMDKDISGHFVIDPADNSIRFEAYSSGYAGGGSISGIVSTDGTEDGVVAIDTVILEMRYIGYDVAPF